MKSLAPQTWSKKISALTILTGSIYFLWYLIGSLNAAAQSVIYWCNDFALVLWSVNPLIAASAAVTIVVLISAVLKIIFFMFNEIRHTIAFRRWCVLRRVTDIDCRPYAMAQPPHWVIRSPKPIALTFGILRPRIVISTALVSLLSTDELTAVLDHEQKHVVRRDPLRRYLWSALRTFFFFIPSIADVTEARILNQEFEADARLIHSTSDSRLHLQSSLQKLIHQTLLYPTVSSCLFSATQRRLHWLFDEKLTPPQATISLGRLVITALIVITAFSAHDKILHALQDPSQSSQAYCQLASEPFLATSPNRSALPAGYMRINYSPILPQSTQP